MSWQVSPTAAALDLLDDDERAIAERLLREDPAFRAAVVEARAIAGALDEVAPEAWSPEPAPPLRLPEEPAVAVPPARRRSWSLPRLRLALPIAAAALAATVALVVFISGGRDERPDTPQQPVVASRRLVLEPKPGVPGSAVLTVTGRKMKLRGRNLPPSKPGYHYAAWLGKGKKMSPLGPFTVSRSGAVDAEMVLHEKLSDYQQVAVTVERGKPGAETTPGGPIVFSASL